MVSRGTTPTYRLILQDTTIDLAEAMDVYVTFADAKYNKIIEKTGTDLVIDGNAVEVFLSQEETLKLPTGELLVQLNWTYDDGGIIKRAASQITRTGSARNLKNEVIE